MQENYTHITVILDRTGSMESIRDDTIGGFNAFLGEQQGLPGKATLTLVQFDSQDPYEVLHRFLPIADIPPLTRLTYVPRASTPLLDALGRGINDLEKSLADLAEADRPAKVIFVTVTDGQENASREFHKSQVEKMIKEKTEKGGWEFVFLSADLGAIGEAAAMGIQDDKRMFFAKDSQGTSRAWAALSKESASFRSGQKSKFGFEDEDLKGSEEEGKKD